MRPRRDAGKAGGGPTAGKEAHFMVSALRTAARPSPAL